MNLLITIFRFEGICLLRQPAILVAVLVYCLLGSYSIYSGQRRIVQQLHTIDSIRAATDHDYRTALQAFTDTATAEQRYQAAHAGDPYLIDYRMPRVAIDEPGSLAGLSIGLRYRTPLSEKVSYREPFQHASQELTNPVLLYVGKIDFAFVLLFLLPLLVIVMCYNLLSVEKEQGTYALLVVQGAGIHRVVVYRLLFRFLLAGGVTLALNLLGLMTGPGGPAFRSDVLLWFLATLTYLLCWFAISYFIISFKKETAVNAFGLLGTWLCLLFVVPGLIGIYTGLRYPVPLRAETEDIERHIGEAVWYTNPRVVVDSFFASHPQYAGAYEPEDTANNQNDAFFSGYEYLKARQMQAYTRRWAAANEAGNRLARQLLWCSPGQQLLEVLNRLAGNSRSDYQDYQAQVAVFRQRWATRFYDRLFTIRNGRRQSLHFRPDELSHLMTFREKKQAANVQELLRSMIPLWLLVAVLLTGGRLLFNRKPTTLT